MMTRRPNPWAERRRFAVQRSERLAAQFGGGFPTNLLSIAKECGVEKIEFRPLLVDGAMCINRNGFSIYVRCEVGQADDLNEAFLSDGSGALLPGKIRNRARFTIAHEIAHTFFYDLRETPPCLKVDVERPSSHMSLERTCDLAASVLLVPESVILDNIRKKDWLDPEVLAAFTKVGFLSRVALVRRLQNVKSDTHPWGALTSIERTNGQCRVMALSAHYSLRHVFPKAVHNAPLSTLVTNPDFLLNGGYLERVKSSRFVFAVEGSARTGRAGSFFVTIKGTESPLPNM